MTHGVIINGETYVAVPLDRHLDDPCRKCDLRDFNQCNMTTDLRLPCEPADVSEVIDVHHVRRVIFIQPTQPKKGQAK